MGDAPPAKVARWPLVFSKILGSDNKKLSLSKAQFRVRRKKTQQALRPIHCGSHLFIPERENTKAVNDGLWTTLINSATEGKMKEYIENSTKCMELVLPKILENKVNDYDKTRKINSFSCSPRPSQSCLSRFGHQILCTNIEGTRRP